MALLPAANYFHLKWDVPFAETLCSGKTGETLHFPADSSLAAIDQNMAPLETLALQMAWNDDGLGLAITSSSSASLPVYQQQALTESDYFDLYFDLRNSKGNHRANQFCQCFRVIPHQSTSQRKPKNGKLKPAVETVEVSRATKLPPTPAVQKILLNSVLTENGYRTEIWFPSETLNGYSPTDQPEIGFHLFHQNSQLGTLTLAADPSMPFDSDPSLWHVLKLIKR